jgi:catechol 2,3-dioxygenase-like lactoylglutathione lyase family enzyme
VITGVSKVVIDVEDQERAKVFWTETMGFELIRDAPYGDERWLVVTTPDKTTNLAGGGRELGLGVHGSPIHPIETPPRVHTGLPPSGVLVSTFWCIHVADPGPSLVVPVAGRRPDRKGFVL